ncbi:MAG: DNA gyrase inhibitor YacG [Alphaproteobacteria bacterium]
MPEVRRPCPICGNAAELRWRPFCSRACADMDLLRWLNERYRIPAVTDPPDEMPEPDARRTGDAPSRWTKGH